MNNILLLFLLQCFTLSIQARNDSIKIKLEVPQEKQLYARDDKLCKRYVNPDNKKDTIKAPLVLVDIRQNAKPVEGVVFDGNFASVSDNKIFKNKLYWVYLLEKEYTLVVDNTNIDMRDYMPIEWDGVERATVYLLTITLPDTGPEIPKSNFTLSAGFNVLPLIGPQISAGFMTHNFCAEVGLVYGLGKSKDTYIYNSGGDLQDAYRYAPMRAFLRAGYEIWAADVFSITPQVGVAINNIHGSRLSVASGSEKVLSGATAISATVGARFMYAPSGRTKPIRLFLTPEFDVAVSKDKNFKALADYDSKIKSWAESLGLSFGLMYYF